MATATTLKLGTSDAGVYSTGPRADSAVKASEVLQSDLDNHHIFFNAEGFHGTYLWELFEISAHAHVYCIYISSMTD